MSKLSLQFVSRYLLFSGVAVGALGIYQAPTAWAQDMPIPMQGSELQGGQPPSDQIALADPIMPTPAPAPTAPTPENTAAPNAAGQGAPSVPVVVPEGSAAAVPPPQSSELGSYKDGLTASDQGAPIAPTGVAVDPADNAFYDANDLVPVPSGQMVKESPIKVNPEMQPASKMIIVKKNYSEDTQTAHLVAAERALELGRYDSALQMFEDLSAKNRKDPRILMGKAVSLQKLGRFEEAMSVYEKLSDLQPNNIDVQVNMLGLLGTKYPAVALRRLLDLHEKKPTHVGLTAQIGVAYANAKDLTSAMRYLGMAASMEPQNAAHIFNMAVMSDRAGESKDAISYYEKALEIDSVYGGGNTLPRDTIYERLANLR